MGIFKKTKSLDLLAADTSRPLPPVRMPRVPATHISGGPPCPYYLDTSSTQKKNQKNQRIRVTARSATELSPTHDFGLPDASSKNIQKQKKIKKKIFFFLTPKKKKKKKKKK